MIPLFCVWFDGGHEWSYDTVDEESASQRHCGKCDLLEVRYVKRFVSDSSKLWEPGVNPKPIWAWSCFPPLKGGFNPIASSPRPNVHPPGLGKKT